MARHSADEAADRYLRQGHARLAALGLSGRFSLDVLHERLQQDRGRRIHLISYPLPYDAPHGLWIAAEGADYVFYPSDASPVRRSTIIGHELGHMAFDDVSTPSALEELAAMLLPRMDPTVPGALLARTTYARAVERRAEIFGTVVAQRVTSWAGLPSHSTPVDPAVLARMRATLEAGQP